MSVQWKADAEGERGPGWYDVAEYVRDLEIQYMGNVTIEASSVWSARQPWGFRITAKISRYPDLAGHGSYGKAFPGNGARTMSGAFYRALVALDAVLGDWVMKIGTQPQDELPF